MRGIAGKGWMRIQEAKMIAAILNPELLSEDVYTWMSFVLVV